MYYIPLKDVSGLGFKGSGAFSNSSPYYAKVPERKEVISFHAARPHIIEVFRLGEDLWEKFISGDLSLVPSGHCCVTGREHFDDCDILFKGEFKTRKAAREMLAQVIATGEITV